MFWLENVSERTNDKNMEYQIMNGGFWHIMRVEIFQYIKEQILDYSIALSQIQLIFNANFKDCHAVNFCWTGQVAIKWLDNGG